MGVVERPFTIILPHMTQKLSHTTFLKQIQIMPGWKNVYYVYTIRYKWLLHNCMQSGWWISVKSYKKKIKIKSLSKSGSLPEEI